MKRILAILILVSLLVPVLSNAEEYKYSLAAGVFTKHFNSKSANEQNRLVAFSYDDWTVAWFKNSYCDESFFAGYDFQTKKWEFEESGKWYLRAGVYTGVVYGYGDHLPTNVLGISPFMLPTGSLGFGQVSFQVGVVPLPGDSGLVTGILKFEF